MQAGFIRVGTRLTTGRGKGHINANHQPAGEGFRIGYVRRKADVAADSTIHLDAIGPLEMHRHFRRGQGAQALGQADLGHVDSLDGFFQGRFRCQHKGRMQGVGGLRVEHRTRINPGNGPADRLGKRIHVPRHRFAGEQRRELG